MLSDDRRISKADNTGVYEELRKDIWKEVFGMQEEL